MGNWYKIVNMDRREAIDPITIGLGNKERQLLAVGNPIQALVMRALFHRWYRDRIHVACDESDLEQPGDYYDRNLRDVTKELLAEHNRHTADKIERVDAPGEIYDLIGEQAEENRLLRAGRDEMLMALADAASVLRHVDPSHAETIDALIKRVSDGR